MDMESVAAFLGRSLEYKRLTEADVPPTIEGVKTLAAAGAWRGVVTLSATLLSAVHPVDVALRLRWFRITALLRMRNFPQAEREFGLLGDLKGPGWKWEHHGLERDGQARRGSMVPFEMLLLHAMMPGYGGNHAQSQQRLYDLLALLRRGSWPESSAGAEAESGAPPGEAGGGGGGEATPLQHAQWSEAPPSPHACQGMSPMQICACACTLCTRQSMNPALCLPRERR